MESTTAGAAVTPTAKPRPRPPSPAHVMPLSGGDNVDDRGRHASPRPASATTTESPLISKSAAERVSADANFWIGLVRDHVDFGEAHSMNRKSPLESLASLQMGMHSLSMRAGFSAHQQHEMLQELEELAEQFDQTKEGVSSLFHLFDDDGDASINHEEFRRGLQSQNLLHIDADGGASFKELVDLVDSDHDQQINLEEFSTCLARLRLARLHVLEKSISQEM